MRKKYLPGISICLFLFISCGDSQKKFEHTWMEKDRNQYMDNCINSASKLGEKAKSYCECSLEKLQGKYPQFESIGALSSEQIREIAQQCLR